MRLNMPKGFIPATCRSLCSVVIIITVCPVLAVDHRPLTFRADVEQVTMSTSIPILSSRYLQGQTINLPRIFVCRKSNNCQLSCTVKEGQEEELSGTHPLPVSLSYLD